MAPASSKASACVRPRPLAAPETRMTRSARLSSGIRLVVPSIIDSGSLDGGAGGSRPGTDALPPLGGSCMLWDWKAALLIEKGRTAQNGRKPGLEADKRDARNRGRIEAAIIKGDVVRKDRSQEILGKTIGSFWSKSSREK